MPTELVSSDDVLLILSTNDWIRIRKVKEQIRTLIDSPHLQHYTEIDVP